jgi:hypothetical protein
MPFATSGDDGTPLRAFANQSEPNPSPRVRRGPTITKERRRGPCTSGTAGLRALHSPADERPGHGAPARNCVIRHGVASGLAGTREGIARRERSEPQPSGLDRRLADRYRALRNAAGSSVLMRRIPRLTLPTVSDGGPALPADSGGMEGDRIPPIRNTRPRSLTRASSARTTTTPDGCSA